MSKNKSVERRSVEKKRKADRRGKDKRMSPQERQKKRRKRKRKRVLFLCFELFILAILCVVGYGMLKLGKLDINILNQNNLEVYKDTGPYTNIACFGLDSRNGELEGGVQSDSIMIVSINNETNDVTLTSVYRDTLLQQADGSYEKANSAYNRGGPEAAISLLNRNFDLDIRNYVSVNFSALVDVIDALGGLEIDMTEEEAFYCNGYAFETAQVVGKDMQKIDEVAGTQLLDGVHAVGYARIRYTEGNDFKRTARQREVLQKTVDKAKKANLLTLNKIVDKVFPQISTSLSITDMLGFAANILNYNIVGTTGFPYAVTTSEDVRNHTGSYVVPIDFVGNVSQLHQNIFAEEWYEPSIKVKQIHDDIIYLTGVSENAQAMQTTFEGDTGGGGTFEGDTQ
ncbi:LytR family transcriptional regulator [Lachnospiraceae bacterium WCA-9-b2]|uniref:LytR family transcriptional regulator n=1 Tax=Sporofaciens musculi TaxID=2681861 RepID=A0A7X3MI90_9FIRM|nr:LCP family protein [Sporofaciens musculi]MXP76896.1 LytR family transcriptional regulator [Sporofaciens musculi]